MSINSPMYTVLSVGKQSALGTFATEFKKVTIEGYGGVKTDIMKASSKPLDDSGGLEQAGAISFVKASVDGIKLDFKQHNMKPFLAGALTANINQNPSTKPIWGTEKPFTGMGTTGYTASGGDMDTIFKVRSLVQLYGNTIASNNILTKVTAVDDTSVTFADTLVDEDIPSGNTDRYAKVVGHEFDTGVLEMSVVGGKMRITNNDATPSDPLFTAFNLELGQEIFIGGDSSSKRFSGDKYGYARISAIADDYIECDLVAHPDRSKTFTPATDTGSSKNIQIFFADFIKNRTGQANIVSHYLTTSINMGNDADGTGFQVFKDSIVNEFKLKVPEPKENSKLEAEVSLLAVRPYFYDGTEDGGTLQVNMLNASEEQDDLLFTSSSEVVSLTIYKTGTGVNPTKFAQHIKDMDFSINRNRSIKAEVGNVYGFDSGIGALEIKGKITVYYDSMSQMKGVLQNEKYGINGIWARTYKGVTSGFCIDIPYVDIMSPSVTPDAGSDAMEIPADFVAKQSFEKNKEGIGFSFFNSLPVIALPIQ